MADANKWQPTMTHNQAYKKLSRLEPQVSPRLHVVQVNGTLWGVNEAVSILTGYDILDCNTLTSRAYLKRLGFEVMRRKEW